MTSESSASGRFWRFNVRQMLALTAVLGVLLAILASRVQNMLRSQQAERELWDSVAPQMALRRAIETGQSADRVREALEAGAKVSIMMNDGSSPLPSAIARGQCETVQVLLDYGADVERSDMYCPRLRSQRPGGPLMALHRGPALFAAVDCDQPTSIKIQMIRILVEHGADIRCQVGDVDLMDLAALYGDGAIADLLGEHGLPYGPREMAACNRIEELQRAIQKSPSLLHERFEPTRVRWQVEDDQVSTLLGIALRKNYGDMARMLIEAGAPLDVLEQGGQTPLHIAARRQSDPKQARMLIEAGAPLDVRDDNGQTPLHIAATWSNDPELIRFLIAHGADVNAVDDKQLTPLAASHHWHKREAARAALIEAGAK
jgi:ankyrin repeat protein